MIFNKRAEVLELAETQQGVFQWAPVRPLLVMAEPQSKTNLFSKVGIGAKTMLFSLRKTGGITLHNAISMENHFYFLTDIQDDGPILQLITAADIQPVHCVAERAEDVGGESREPSWETRFYADFPAALAEKYIKFEQTEPMARTETSYVLITPKAIRLRVSDLVQIDGFLDQYENPLKFAVQVCHTLDEYKNEYEIVGKWDA